MGVNERAKIRIDRLRRKRCYADAEIIEIILSRNKILFDELANAAIILHSLGDEKTHHELSLILNDIQFDDL